MGYRQALLLATSFAVSLSLAYTFTSVGITRFGLIRRTTVQQRQLHKDFGMLGTSHTSNRSHADLVNDDFLKNTAFISFAAGDEAARMVIAWLQSLRDVGTRVPTILIMLVGATF
jgi:hypothetical protein